jgi:hypothetical protein
LSFVLVERVLRLAHLLGVEGPVPRLELERRLALGRLFLVDHRLQVGRFAARVGDRRRRELAEHVVDGLRGLRGFVFEHERGVVG